MESRISVVKTFRAGFHVWNLWIGNENFYPRDGILRALMGLSKHLAHWWFVWIMRIYFFDIYEVGGIDIFGAGRIRPVFFVVEVVDTNYWTCHGPCSLKMVSPRRQSNEETDVFLCLTRQTGILWFPPGVEFWDCYWGRYFETGFWIWLRDAQNFDGTRCGEDSQIRIRKYFELGNNVGRIDKSLGCLEKKPGIFCAKKKKKKNARKLLKKFYYKSGLIYGTIDWNWINWEANL